MKMIETIWGIEYHHFETVKNLERQRDDFRNMLDLVLAEKEQLRKERDGYVSVPLEIIDPAYEAGVPYKLKYLEYESDEHRNVVSLYDVIKLAKKVSAKNGNA